MKNSKLFYIAILVFPWLTVPLLGMKAFKKFFPAAMFICIFTKAIDIYGEKKRWWRFYKGIPPFDSMNFFNLGPYFVTSLWILKLTYGRFLLYIISNVILHIIFIYCGGVKLVKYFKIFTLVKLTKFQYLLLDFVRALLLYFAQYLTEFIRGRKHQLKGKGDMRLEET